MTYRSEWQAGKRQHVAGAPFGNNTQKGSSMPLNEYSDALCRCELMAKGSASWNISKEDSSAIKALLQERLELKSEIANLKLGNEYGAEVEVIANRTQNRSSDEVTAAIDICAEIEELIEALPAKAEAFGMSVGEKVRSIRDRIEESQDVTEAQMTALENMHAGCKKWGR